MISSVLYFLLKLDVDLIPIKWYIQINYVDREYWKLFTEGYKGDLNKKSWNILFGRVENSHKHHKHTWGTLQEKHIEIRRSHCINVRLLEELFSCLLLGFWLEWLRKKKMSLSHYSLLSVMVLNKKNPPSNSLKIKYK